MFCNQFVIQYNHFDAMNLSNPYQITLNATCHDMGVYLFNQNSPQQNDNQNLDFTYKLKNSLIKNKKQILSEIPESDEDKKSSEWSENENKKPTDVIYKMHENTEDIMKIEINFGN